MSNDEQTPAEAAYKRAVEAYAEWLMAYAEEKRAEALFWQTPTERSAEGLARAHFDTQMAHDRADSAETEWKYAGRTDEWERIANRPGVWGGVEPGSCGAVSFAPGAGLSGSSGTVEIGGAATYLKREDHTHHRDMPRIGEPSE